MRSLDFSIDLILRAELWLRGSSQHLTEMSTRNLPLGKGRPPHEADNLTAICEPTVLRKCGSLDVSQPYELPWLVTGTDLLSFYY
jgi:hypothetical protein